MFYRESLSVFGKTGAIGLVNEKGTASEHTSHTSDGSPQAATVNELVPIGALTRSSLIVPSVIAGTEAGTHAPPVNLYVVGIGSPASGGSHTRKGSAEQIATMNNTNTIDTKIFFLFSSF